MNHTRPFLKWAGSKYNCLQHILDALPKAKRLIEPFAGSGAVFINTHYPAYLIAEQNHDLINLFLFIKHEGDSFIDYCQSFFCDANNVSQQYYHLRQEFNECSDPRQRAALFLYLNRHGYNGLCRYNQQGRYNVPFGRYIKPLFPKERMQFFHLKSQHIEFKHSDFQDTFANAERGDLIYCDPPYAPLNQVSNFSDYTGQKFGETEQILLAELSAASAKRGITVVISNHDTDFTRHHYRESDIHSFLVRRHINRDSTNRVPVRELVAVFAPSSS